MVIVQFRYTLVQWRGIHRTDGVAHTVLFQAFAQTDITNLDLTRSLHHNTSGYPNATRNIQKPRSISSMESASISLKI